MRLPESEGPAIRYVPDEQGEYIALRATWFVLAGWWLSAIWVVIAWLAILLGVTRRIGFRMIAQLPRVKNLRSPGDERCDFVEEVLERIEHSQRPQLPLIVRLIYFITIGWWLSMIWTIVAWGENLSIQRRPTALVMFMRLPAVMTLRRY